ncbi:hypothetical protein NSPZN2_30012 [Nitrospira defluvii]|uniref:Aldehyde dehydrogenase domain-containing protein n=1 Tax=Nitrospira defluvii TaxID=330214 RepID=A0ABM8RDX7_9BACT|nr:hypothetical protein NSPZN2_30012 [Nitrospira defluvii]
MRAVAKAAANSRQAVLSVARLRGLVMSLPVWNPPVALAALPVVARIVRSRAQALALSSTPMGISLPIITSWRVRPRLR